MSPNPCLRKKKNSYYNCRDGYQILRVYLNKDMLNNQP